MAGNYGDDELRKLIDLLGSMVGREVVLQDTAHTLDQPQSSTEPSECEPNPQPVIQAESDLNPQAQLDFMGSMLGREVTLQDSAHTLDQPQSSTEPFDREPHLVEEVVQYKHVAQPKKKRLNILNIIANSPSSTPPPGDEHQPDGASITSRQNPKTRLPKYFDLTKGEKSPSGIEFAAWPVAATYPDFYIGKANKPRAKPFFDKKFDGHRWDFFYVYSPNPRKHRWPFLLVPTEQFVHFLGNINKALDICLTIPAHVGDKYFRLTFGRAGTPVPRYLGQVTNQGSYEKVKASDNIPPDDYYEHWKQASGPVAQDYEEMLDVIHNFGRGRGTASSRAKSQKNAMDNRRERKRMMMDVQKSLGLIPEEAHVEYRYGPFNCARPPPYLPSNVPIFVAVDVENLETMPDVVTEIGLAFLDVDQIKGIPPGRVGENWWEHIVTRHIRVREYSGLCNYKYVQGCPDNFDFGKSTFPSRDDTLAALMKEVANHTEMEMADGTIIKRDTIFTAHDINQDERHLLKVGFVVSDMNAKHRADSKVLHQYLRGLDQGRRLGTILDDFDIRYQYLHNAGNDAHYCLRALIAAAVAHAEEEGKKPSLTETKKIEAAAKKAGDQYQW